VTMRPIPAKAMAPSASWARAGSPGALEPPEAYQRYHGGVLGRGGHSRPY